MQTPIFAFLGSGDMMVIGVVMLVLFGAKKVPELMKGLGTGIKEFKKASQDVQDELERAIHDDPPPQPKRSLPAAAPAEESRPSESQAPHGAVAQGAAPTGPEAHKATQAEAAAH